MLRVLSMVNEYNTDDLYIDDNGEVYEYKELSDGHYLKNLTNFGLSNILLFIEHQKNIDSYSNEEYSKLISILRRFEKVVHNKIELLANTPRQLGNTYSNINRLQKIYEELSKIPEEDIKCVVQKAEKIINKRKYEE